MNFKKTILASLLMISASGAFAGTTATLAVEGTIAPTSCDVTIGGIANGKLTFDVDDYNGNAKALTAQTVDFKITCNPIALAMKFSVVDDKRSSGQNGAGFGLGMHSSGNADVKIGSYNVSMSAMTTDSKPSRLLIRKSGSANWDWETTGMIFADSSLVSEFTFGNVSALTPEPAKSFASTLTVGPTINAGLPVGDSIALDGSLSVEIRQI